MNESAWTLIGFAAVMVIVIAGLSMISQHYTLNIKSRTVGDGQHGTARWATKQEIHHTYHLVRFDPQAWRRGKDLPKMQGIIAGSVGRNPAPLQFRIEKKKITIHEDSNAYTVQFFDEFNDLHNGSCGYTLIADNECKVTINGGTFKGPVRMNASNSKWNKTTSRVIITGGTFEKDVVLNGAGSTTGDGKVTLAEIKGGTFLGKVQAWAAASFENSFSTPEVVISGGDFSKEFWLRPKFPLVNNKEQRGVAYQVAAKLNGGTFHEGFSAEEICRAARHLDRRHIQPHQRHGCQSGFCHHAFAGGHSGNKLLSGP